MDEAIAASIITQYAISHFIIDTFFVHFRIGYILLKFWQNQGIQLF